MKLLAAVQVLRLLNTRPEGALSVREIARKWSEQAGGELHIRSLQRYMSELSADSVDGPALVGLAGDDRERKYFLHLPQVAHWFMTAETAFDVILSQQVLASSFGLLHEPRSKNLTDLAGKVSGDFARTRRLLQHLRVVPDGVGRLRADISVQVLRSAADAICWAQRLTFRYTSSSGHVSSQDRTPLGLVAKDGTIYLLATEGVGDAPRHFPLHRMADASVAPCAAQPRPDFDLDRYIEASHQLGHELERGSVALKARLRVAPSALFHFAERRLAADQEIELRPDGWHDVTATVPRTILLVPFLASMGRGIEVLEPAELRQDTGAWLRDAAAHYTPAAAA